MKTSLSFLVLFLSLQAAAQSSLLIGAGPSVNHISMDVRPALIPNFDVAHRLSVNAEVLYGYRLPNRWQLLAGAGMFSIKYGIEGGPGVQPYKSAFPGKYFRRKDSMHFKTKTPFFMSAGAGYAFVERPYFEADVSLMLDAVYFKSLNLMPLEGTSFGTYYLFDQYNYRTGWKFYWQPGIRLKRMTPYNLAYWIKIKGSVRASEVLEVPSTALEYEGQDYEASIRTSGSTFAVMAGLEVPLKGGLWGRKIRDAEHFAPKRQLITARAGISAQFPVLVEDTGNMLKEASHIGGYLGLSLEERLSGPLYVGIGLTRYTMSTFYKFSLPTAEFSSGTINHSLLGIPVSLAWYQSGKRWSVRLAGSLGYLINFDGSGSSYGKGTTSFQNGDAFQYTTDTEVSRSTTPYLDLDASGSYSLSGRMAFFSFMGYSHGFKNMFESQISYQFNDQQEHPARMHFGLRHLNAGLGLRYALTRY